MYDFYSKFNGEPEIRLVLKVSGHSEITIRMWAGYFDSIMAEIQPENGRWTGLALPYHLHEGWYTGKPWKAANLPEVSAQWERIPAARLTPECRDAYFAVLKLMRCGIESCGELWISEE